ncbi:DoxX family protein [Streptomyces aureocirculatus]|uniref:DoxX family protein n=1 Tax=Streptomyces aureocirculatus TaxID=67275 RepID=UPI0004C7E1C4|nr:DoxX family protein [Streptomyces aureocirculatus]
MDTRTPRTPTGGRSSGFDDTPALSMVKVPCDPAQVIVNHASFRVQLPTAGRTQSPRIARHLNTADDTVRIAAVAPAPARRRAPVVWSGKSAPGDLDAGGLLQAARASGVRRSAEGPGRDGDAGTALGGRDPYDDGGSTQTIPRVDLDDPYRDPAETAAFTPPRDPAETAAFIPPRHPGDGTRLLPQMRLPGSADDEHRAAAAAAVSYADEDDGDGYDDGRGAGPDEYDDRDETTGRRTGAGLRHAYFPGRRMNLGVVLLPLRVFLGFISIYAGMGKLCDPVYFDGGERGSMVKWLNSLHPWALAEPLRDWALQHPVGAGLVIAFLQVIVGVLTVLGLWQRVAASIGVLLSAALLVTVSWKTVPAYDAPDIIYLAAWSPLIIAGAPVYSIDGRLASEAWRTLGPRAELWELRRRVLRRGALVGAVVVGLTLLIGSVLGGAVRDADRVTVPGPGEAPRNELPGSPLPEDPDNERKLRRDRQSPTAPTDASAPTQGSSASPTQGAAGTPGAAPETGGGGVSEDQPSATQGTGGQAPSSQQRQQAPPQQEQPAASSGPAATTGGGTGGTGTTSGGATSSGTSSGGTGTSGGSSTGGSGDKPGGLLGGVLG